ncbi:hypothetical protein FLA_5867 [Filimonas lacunae]|nr:hypothetical protein FLA_5867 [Filimonas lacunae]
MDDLLQTGLTNTPVTSVLSECKAVCNHIRKDLITKMATLPKKGKKSCIANTRKVLVEIYDRLDNGIQQFRKRESSVIAYSNLLYEIKKVLCFIEQRWLLHCSGDVKKTDREIFDIRSVWCRKFRVLKKQCRGIDKALSDAVLQTLFSFISTKKTYQLTADRIDYVNDVFLQLEQLLANASNSIKLEGGIMSMLISKEFNAPLFIAYYKQHLDDKIHLLTAYDEKIAGYHLALAHLNFLLPVSPTPLFSSTPSLQDEITYWVNGSVTLLKEKEHMHRCQNQTGKEIRKPDKIIYKEPAFVVAETYKMMLTCGFILNDSFAQLCNAVIETGDIGKGNSCSGNYLESATRRNREKSRKIIREYVMKFLDYLDGNIE